MTAETGRDDRLARTLATLADRRCAGLAPDVEAAAAAEPDLADELRDLWSAAELIAAVVGGGGSPSGLTVDRPPPAAAAPDRPEAAGERVGGCVLLEEIGRGGMGVVHRALQVDLDRVVALKRMHAGGTAGPQELARFRAEAEAAARLDHPNIVPVYAVETDGGEPYILMRYLAGTTLARLLADGPLPAVEAARRLAPVCRAIQFAHDRGVLHRDLKPSNILIDESGRPHVSDFGLAKRVGLGDGEPGLTLSGAAVGTPSYMAPEQAAAGRGAVGPAADVYGLGAVLYQMLTGRPPFQAATPLETILLVLEQDVVPPRVLNPGADADLEMVALKCLEKSPSNRYPSASALADDLDAFLAGEPVSARATGLRDLARRLLGETHHAAVLENWGALWMMHAGALLVFYGLTNWLTYRGVTARWPYMGLFTVGLGAWAAVFWHLRRLGGPVTFVERLLAHVWAAGVIAINLLFVAEWLMGLPVLALAPLLPVVNGSLFVIEGGFLAGSFYLQAGLIFLTILPMVRYPAVGPLLFGVVSALCFFATGLKFHRRKRLGRRLAAAQA